MSEEKKKVKNKNGKVVWIILVLVVLVVLGFVGYKFVFNKSDENSISEQVELNGDYNLQLQEVQKKIDEKEETINKLNEEMLPLLEERTSLEQQLIELSGESE